jgi:hypothetical protein
MESRPEPTEGIPMGNSDRRKLSAHEQVIGVYVTAIANQQTPPSPQEIAKRLGCHVGTVYRAIKPFEQNRKDLEKSRY